MGEYIELNRHFGLLTKYTADELVASAFPTKQLTWDKVLEGRFSIIVGRANFGKTMELKAKSKALRTQEQSAIYIALHNVLGADSLEDALETEDRDTLSAWRQSGGELIAFVDSLDEASLGTENGIRRAIQRLSKALDWPNSNIRWILSSRPAVLTEDILALLQAELRTAPYTGASEEAVGDTTIADTAAVLEDNSEGNKEPSAVDAPNATIGEVASANAASKTEHRAPVQEQMRIYSLLPLDKAGAALYLIGCHSMPQPERILRVARQYGLGRLTEGPGGLDILAFIDPVKNPPHCLTQVFERMVEAVQQQQRIDPRELRVGNPPPESLEKAIERLASASAVCQLPNIELSPKALHYRDGVLSARPIIASLLSEQSLEYLLGSRLFIDAGLHQVKLYPEELLAFLAAKYLASLVKSPEHSQRLLANFTWRSTTGECGVYRALLPLTGWLAVFSTHCRKELLNVEPQAVALFGDLRNPQVQLAEALDAIERTLKRLVLEGDSLGRRYYTLTDDNYWQAAKPGIEPELLRLFGMYGDDWRSRDMLLEIAGHARFEVLRDTVLDAHGRDYSKLLDAQPDLNYILSLKRTDDNLALGAALRGRPDLPESQVAHLVTELAWTVLDAKSIAEIAAEQFRKGRNGFSIDWALTHAVAEEASDVDLYRLTRSLMLRLANTAAGLERGTESYYDNQKFVELTMDLLAQVIQHSAVEPSRAASYCVVLNRVIRDHHQYHADTTKLKAALHVNKEVRLKFLRGIIRPTNKTADDIYHAVFVSNIYPHVDGDELALGEPGFAELIERSKKRVLPPPRKPNKQRKLELIVDQKTKVTLSGMLDGIRDASNESALAWVGEWLSRTVQQVRYGECDFAIFEQAASGEIAQAVREGLGALWRGKDPKWNEAEPNSTYHITIAGLNGLHLYLGDGSQLPALSELEVRQAIRYAQFEINGYPRWFWNLVHTYEQIAVQELGVILANASNGQVSLSKAESLIQHLDEAPINVQHSLARAVWNFVLNSASLTAYSAEKALAVSAANTGVIDQKTFEEEAWRRIGSAFDEEIPSLGDVPVVMDAETQKARQELERRINELSQQRSNATVWGAYWLRQYPETFAQWWELWRANNTQDAERFILALAAKLGEDDGASLRQVAINESGGLNTLKALYEWVHLVVKEGDDIKHEDGRVYSRDERDNARHMRDALIPAISHAKSEQAYQVLEELRLRASDNQAKYLRHVQFMMREDQYARKPISQQEYLEFERTFAPNVSDYIAFAMAVETDLLTVKSQIETGDFSLRRFFSSLNFNRIKTDNDGLALEEDFQALLGSELNHAAGSRYGVTLEPILPGGTRRDVLCQTASLRATVELKMSFKWTLADYIEALEMQLQGQYMMAPNSKIGFFVVVLQEKTRTWAGPDGKTIGFDDLLCILRGKAREKEIADASVYLRVIGIDATPKEDFRSAKSLNKAPGIAAGHKYADGAGNTWSGRGPRPKWLKDELASGKSLNDFLARKLEL